MEGESPANGSTSVQSSPDVSRKKNLLKPSNNSGEKTTHKSSSVDNLTNTNNASKPQTPKSNKDEPEGKPNPQSHAVQSGNPETSTPPFQKKDLDSKDQDEKEPLLKDNTSEQHLDVAPSKFVVEAVSASECEVCPDAETGTRKRIDNQELMNLAMETPLPESPVIDKTSANYSLGQQRTKKDTPESECTEANTNATTLPTVKSETRFTVEAVPTVDLQDDVAEEVKALLSNDNCSSNVDLGVCSPEKIGDEKLETPVTEEHITATVQDEDYNLKLQRQLSVTRMTLEQALQGVLDQLGIEKDIWVPTDSKNHLMDSLLMLNIFYVNDYLYNVAFNIFNADWSVKGVTIQDGSNEEVNRIEKTASPEVYTKPKSTGKERTERNEFLKSIKSRLIVAQVVETVKSNSALTFDFLLLTALASLISGIGLAENSSVILVASMLVSPLMGPIMGGTFGFVIGNEPLCRLGVKNETIGLALCLLNGFIVGMVVALSNAQGVVWGSSTSYPTTEMSSRGMLRSLGIGIVIAIPSGAGVALSILGGNAGSLVGVAISASLLPPAINAGMLWALALVATVAYPTSLPSNDTSIVTDTSNMTSNMTVPPTSMPSYTPPNCPALYKNDYKFHYDCDMAKEAFILGFISLMLTLLNILCIFIMGILILKVKEVAPHTAISEASEAFWKNDIKMARESYKTQRGPESQGLAKIARSMAKEIVEKRKKSDDEQMGEESCEEEEMKIARSIENIMTENLMHVVPHRRPTIELQLVEDDDDFTELIGRVPNGLRKRVRWSSDPKPYHTVVGEPNHHHTVSGNPSYYNTVSGTHIPSFDRKSLREINSKSYTYFDEDDNFNSSRCNQSPLSQSSQSSLEADDVIEVNFDPNTWIKAQRRPRNPVLPPSFTHIYNPQRIYTKDGIPVVRGTQKRGEISPKNAKSSEHAEKMVSFANKNENPQLTTTINMAIYEEGKAQTSSQC